MMKGMSLSEFYASIRELAEPTSIAVQGAIRGVYYPTGTEPAPVTSQGVQELEDALAEARTEIALLRRPARTNIGERSDPLNVPQRHPDQIEAARQRQMDQAAAQRELNIRDQRQRDEWLKRAFPQRPRG